MSEEKPASFSGTIGFVLAAAGSAVGLGNLWRFPYLAAQNGGGLFLVIYLFLLVTFGFALLITEVAIGRRTRHSPLKAYGALHPRWRWIGGLAVLVPFLILPYYCAIGGWVMKYGVVYLTGQGATATQPGFFTGFIGSVAEPLLYMALFLGLTVFVVYRGVNEGIERISTVLMPLLILIVIGISAFSLTISYDDGTVTRTGLDGLRVFIVPDWEHLTWAGFMAAVLDAMGQLFFSISVAMGIMIAYGAYADDRSDLFRSVGHIQFFDTFVAFLAGLMTIVPLYVAMGREGMNASGPSLLFVSLPKMFEFMGSAGGVLGAVFFLMAFFAALTSSISIMEAVVSSIIEQFGVSRERASLVEGAVVFVLSAVVCLGYNVLYVKLPMPGGGTGQILDLMDYLSNGVLMPVVSIATCLLVGWAVGPEVVIDEATKNGEPFRWRRMYAVMIRYIAPVLLGILLLQSLGLI